VPLSALLRWTGGGPLVVYYHSITNSPPPHVSGLYRGRTIREFEDDLDYLLREFHPISLATLRGIVSGEAVCPEKAFLVTFDDGLRETAENVAPILSSKGLETVFFASSGFLENTDLSYRFKVSLILNRLREQSPGPLALQELGRLLPSSIEASGSVEERLLSIQYAERGVLDRAAELVDLDFRDYLSAQRPYLGRTELIDLQKRGFHVGAHSVDHPPYAALSVAEQLIQTRTSCSVIAALTGAARVHFAFPFSAVGVSAAFYQSLAEEQVVDLFFGTSGWTHNFRRRLVSRVSFEGNRLSAPGHVRQTMARSIMDRGRSALLGGQART